MVQYNEKRSTQAAAEFLKRAEGKLNYMVLLKFLYLADRESLLKWGMPITGDEYLSMRWGPVLSKTHDLITEEFPEEEEASSFWKNHIAREKYDVVLRNDPGNDELSDADEKLIAYIFERFFTKYKELNSNPFAFCDFLHTVLPEYKTAERGQSFSLDHHDILVAGSKNPEEIREVEALLSSIGKMQKAR
jgi:hypothetical protein